MYPLVYFLRHGETDWNAEGRLQGQADTDINALGREQATRNGRELAKLLGRAEGFDFVASPMRRTRETMERVRTAMGLDPKDYCTDARLIEVHFGDWQGSTFAEIEVVAPGSTKARRRNKWNFRPPGAAAESYEMLKHRAMPWLETLTRQTVCVTHGGIVRVLFRTIANMPEREAANLHVPQDRVLRLRDGMLEWL
ncbi:probable phosphoglycerate mutase [Mesorhizobium albiziae]|uniref:Probable phosphoglycerate mutase n=1 Tax=Neomesorhizobium albiziae TaxID=335020 RepID=A0A1I4E069_9HYPH|nr:histidine phosphatase family protein [Mesorhizobium albiziae]GLS32710.1 phosphoglycerate mutase [Mesorhizobium albiziae]SFK97917.1 probable phosphoglycerate mutase [Mesorhizobium albiziae]